MPAAAVALASENAQPFVAFDAELHRTVRNRVNTSAANIADAWLTRLRAQPDRQATVRGWLVVVAIREARSPRPDRPTPPLPRRAR